MTDEQKAAYVIAMATCAMGEIAAMQASNQANTAAGKPILYHLEDFSNVAVTHGIHHNAVLTLFHGH